MLKGKFKGAMKNRNKACVTICIRDILVVPVILFLLRLLGYTLMHKGEFKSAMKTKNQSLCHIVYKGHFGSSRDFLFPQNFCVAQHLRPKTIHGDPHDDQRKLGL